MAIKLTKNDLKQFNNLFKNMQKNIEIADFTNNILLENKNIANNYDTHFSYWQNISNYFDLAPEFLNYYSNFNLLNNFIKLDKTIYENNPYVNNIKIDNISYLNYYFQKETIKAFQGFIYDEIDVLDDFTEITKIGYFENDYSYLTLKENNDIWMLITPHEINTMKKAIEKANNNVLTLGLGLGYFPFMCSLKDNVKNITIIEKDNNIIKLFKKYIYPQFKNKEKIKIIQSDALNYLDNNNLKSFDYIFIDLYKDVDDGLPLYVDIIKRFKNKLISNYDFWIENSLIIMLRRCLIKALYELLNDISYTSNNLNYYDQLIDNFKNIFKNIEINNFKQIQNLLLKENILKLL